MAETELDKSEQPTPYKLERSRKRGIVARGMDLSFLTGLAALFFYAWIGGGLLGRSVERSAHDALVVGPALTDSNASLLSAMAFVFSPVLRPMLLLFFAVFLVVLVFEIVQTGFVFSTQPLKPDFSRLNPANGLKRVFSFRLLIETLKNILKLLVYVTIAFLVIRGAVQSDVRSIVDGRGLLETLKSTGLRLLSLVVLAAVVFMIIDQIISRGQFLKKMRMNRRELRQESREREGEPRMKQKRKQLHREFAKASQSMRGLKKADVLITNPQHIALGLHYEPGVSTAPTVVSVGINQFAQRLKRMAFLYGIPIVENKALARELYAKAALNRPIPENCYKPVADIYNSIRRKLRARDAE
jgi:flagellar biosynthetic protein FlhB